MRWSSRDARAALRPLIVVNALLLAVAVTSLVYAVRELWRPAETGRVVAKVASHTPQAVSAEPIPDGAYAVVAGRNLFSPTRSEVTVAVAPSSTAPVAKPNLYGVVLRDGGSIAYLEDPTTKRVARYRVGDIVGGGTVRSIAPDHVVLARGDATVEVRLNDPSKPRVAAVIPTNAAHPEPQLGVGPQSGVTSAASTPPISIPRQRLRSPFPPRVLPTRPDQPSQQ
jgi:hypothetical protein